MAQADAFMAGLLGLSVQALSDVAQTIPDCGGVVFVPHLAGLGAPHWDDRATGTVTGMTHATTNANLARATFEAVACQIVDLFTATARHMDQTLTSLRADGRLRPIGFW